MSDDLDRHEAAWLRGELDSELSDLGARPEALRRILDRAGDAAGTRPGDAPRARPLPEPGSGRRRPPAWLVAAAAVAAVAAAVPLVRQTHHGGAPTPGAVATTPPASATTTSAPATSGRPTPSPSATHSPHVIPPPTGTGGTSTTPRCDGSSLVVSVSGPDGAAGTIFYTVVLTNTGRAPCYLKGYPGVAATGGGPTLDAQRDPALPPSRVVLQPGRAAHAVVAVRNVPSSATPCPVYAQLLVTAPDSTRTTTFPLRVQPCDGGLRVGAVQPGAG